MEGPAHAEWEGRVRRTYDGTLPGWAMSHLPVVFGRQPAGSDVGRSRRPGGARWAGRGSEETTQPLPGSFSARTAQKNGKASPWQACCGPYRSACALRVLCGKPGLPLAPSSPCSLAVPGHHGNPRAACARPVVEGGWVDGPPVGEVRRAAWAAQVAGTPPTHRRA